MAPDPETSINYNFQIPEKPSRYLRAFLILLQSIENWDTDATLVCYDEAINYRILPASLGHPARSMKEYEQFWKDVRVIFGGNKFVVTIHEVIEAGHKLAVHCSSRSISARGNPYANEYSLFIHFVPLPAGMDLYSPPADGEALPKIAFMKEFVDTLSTSTFFTAEGAEGIVRQGE